MRDFPNGVWPTMITPFLESGQIDYGAVEELVEWYRSQGVDGLFAACQSSEIFYLSLRERAELVRFIKRKARELPVIASGHISNDMDDQVRELNAMAEAGADAVVLISNRLAGPGETDEVFLRRLQRVMDGLPRELPLGFYECPYPYKRLLTPEVVRFCAASGRFAFLKDTSCAMADIRTKLDLAAGSPLKLYNANTATLLDSLNAGAAGYSGVMANVQPSLYVWLVRHYQAEPEKARVVQNILTACSWLEFKHYPDCAKGFLRLSGLSMKTGSRTNPGYRLSDTEWDELRQLGELTGGVRRWLAGETHKEQSL